MAKSIGRVPGVCHGMPTLEGTRLTCADVVLVLPRFGLEDYLKVYPHLSPADLRAAIEYCAEQRCLENNDVAYCERCSLDRTAPPPAPSVFIPSIADLAKTPIAQAGGQAFLGTPEDYEEDRRPLDVWKQAAEILRTFPRLPSP